MRNFMRLPCFTNKFEGRAFLLYFSTSIFGSGEIVKIDKLNMGIKQFLIVSCINKCTASLNDIESMLLMSIHFKSFFIVYDPKKIHNLFSIYEFENLMLQYHAGYNLVLVTNVVSIFVLVPAHCTKFYLLKWTQIENHKHVQKYELHSKDIWRHQLYVSVKIF